MLYEGKKVLGGGTMSWAKGGQFVGRKVHREKVFCPGKKCYVQLKIC